MVLLLIDVLFIGRRPHVPSLAESGLHLAFCVTLAILFGLGVWYFSDADFAAQFFAGWLTEYSLSLDNLFEFELIMSRCRMPDTSQRTVLVVGILLALLVRGILIADGPAGIARFNMLFAEYGGTLI